MLTIVAIPGVAILLVGACVSGYLVDQGVRAQTFADDVRAVLGPTTRFIASAEEERRLTVLRLSQPIQSRVALDDQRRQVDAALADLSAAGRRLTAHAPRDLQASLTAFDQAAGQLPDIRQRVDAFRATAQDAYTFYNDLLALCGATIQGIARSATDAQVGFEQMISYDLFTSAEAMSRAHVMAVRAVSSGLSPDQFHELAHQLGMYHERVETLVPRMTAPERDRYAALKTTAAWKELVADDNFLMNHGPTPAGAVSVPFEATTWEDAARQVSDALTALYTSHSGFAADLGSASARRSLATSLASGVAILLVAVTVMLVALRLSRRLVRRLTRLRQETLALAERGLPVLVHRLASGRRVDLATEVPWLDHGEDEIGQVAKAFNAAQRAAIAATVREAETRQGVREVFLNIAHRSQVIVHRQLAVLDRAERSLEDPDQLQLLFQLDHLATRSRRNAENLIILGGGQAGRQWRNPVPLRDVVRSAIAETEHYTRVTPLRLPDVPMIGTVVADLIHLLAELVDNATSFSPPQSQVEVRGNTVGRGVAVEIEDQGLGIGPEEVDRLNAMLHDPPDFNVMALSSEPRIGLFVVARLAARHGIKVTLRESVYDGTRATVLVPASLVTSTAALEPAGESQPAENGAARHGAEPGLAGSAEPTVRWHVPALEAGEQPLGELAEHIGRNGAAGNGHAGDAGAAVVNGAVDESGAEAVQGSTATDLPPLPRRERQANLVPQLMEDGADPATEGAEDAGLQRSAERSRSRMAAFQHGTRRARAAEPESAPEGASARVDEDDDGRNERQ